MIEFHLLVLEVNFIIAGLICFLHSIINNKLHIALGIFLFGIICESISILPLFGLETHSHAQFNIQVFDWIALKEVFWYDITLYTSFITAYTAKEKGIIKPYGAKYLMGIISILLDTPYECTNNR